MMAGEFAGRVKIVAVDVDQSRDVAQEYEVSAMPTLVLMKGSEEVGRVKGASKDKIRALIENAL